MVTDEQDLPAKDRFIARVQKFPMSVDIFSDEMIAIYHKHGRVALFVDGTGAIVDHHEEQAIVSDGDTTRKKHPLNFTAQIPQEAAGSRARPPFIIWEHVGMDLRGSALAASLLFYRSREKKLFGYCIIPRECHSDCGLNLLAPILLVYNGETFDDYDARVRKEFAGEIPRSQTYLLYVWCLWHCHRAITLKCKKDMTEIEVKLHNKVQWGTIGCRMFDYVREATSMADFEHRKLMVESMLTAEDIIEDLREGLVFKEANETSASGEVFLIFRYALFAGTVTPLAL
ncbi:hypothetical protein CYMTET_43720 [Cymbomonas tetramitiformis]|uniref:Uncharacterized protein n=1 Tax=Cymbomonas tetramitiformis TaxID=36881 RepID=A0AAE0F008_9CHLO|nr:hypothetical protein CYMTET_43720 [Cymbomonas tetramitiformis]